MLSNDKEEEKYLMYPKTKKAKFTTSNKSHILRNAFIFTIIIILGINITIAFVDNIKNFQVFAQPAQDYPIPDSKRMFSNDTALVKKYDLDPYILDLAIKPKMPIAISDSSGKPIAVFPNNHGHGSVIEFEYYFPKKDTYTVDLILGQQTGSPNFMIEPKVIREMNFTVTVDKEQQQQQQVSQSNSSTGNVKDISMKVESWKFTPNVVNVNKGDLVRLHFVTAQDEVALYNGHGFGIEKYNVNAFLLKGTQQTVQFIADKPGTFTFRCTSFCSAPEAAIENHFNMIGKLIVH